MSDDDTQKLLGALAAHLSDELTCHRHLYEMAESKRREIVAGEIANFSKVLAAEREHLQRGNQLRIKRDRLLFHIARRVQVPTDRLRMAQLLERAEEPLRSQLQGLSGDLRELLLNLRALNERNMVLIRQSLGFLQDVMDTMLGEARAEGYDTAGHDDRDRPSGSLLNYEA